MVHADVPGGKSVEHAGREAPKLFVSTVRKVVVKPSILFLQPSPPVLPSPPHCIGTDQ